MSETHESGDGSGSAWMLPIVGSSLCWALADLVCDVVIGEELDECSGGIALDEDGNVIQPLGDGTSNSSSNIVPGGGGTGGNSNNISNSGGMNIISGNHHGYHAVVPENSENKSKDILIAPTDLSISTSAAIGGLTKRGRASSVDHSSPKSPNGDSDGKDEEESKHMTGNQECAVSGMVTMMVVYGLCMHRWTSRTFKNKHEQGLIVSGNIIINSGPIWSPVHDYEWWVAAFGGCLLFYHYLVLYWAHETAPSTVINPLLQVSSTWLLLGSAIPAMINNSTYIEPFDLLCYTIVVFGGMLPSLNGNMRAMASLKFWKRDFVRYSFLSEVTIGVYDLLLSSVLKAAAAKEHSKLLNPYNTEPIRALDHGALENEFFFIAWCWFAISFAMSYAFSSLLRQEFIGLWKLPSKIIVFSAIGQCLTLSGYYLSQFAFSLFYQVSVVHGAEASLGQAFNLITAFIAKKVFNVGRDSVVMNMKVKIVSVLIVALGLGLLAHRDMIAFDKK